MTSMHNLRGIKMPVNINVTYETWDEEAIEVGETDVKGFLAKDTPCSFRELVDLLACSEASVNPLPKQPSVYIWYTEYGESDMFTGEVTNHSFHATDTRSARYLLKAYKLTH